MDNHKWSHIHLQMESHTLTNGVQNYSITVADELVMVMIIQLIGSIP